VLIASPARSLWRFLGCRALAARSDLGDRRAGMMRLAPVACLAAAFEFHRLDVWTGDDEVAFNDPHGECGHRPTTPLRLLAPTGLRAGRPRVSPPPLRPECANRSRRRHGRHVPLIAASAIIKVCGVARAAQQPCAMSFRRVADATRSFANCALLVSCKS